MSVIQQVGQKTLGGSQKASASVQQHCATSRLGLQSGDVLPAIDSLTCIIKQASSLTSVIKAGVHIYVPACGSILQMDAAHEARIKERHAFGLERLLALFWSLLEQQELLAGAELEVCFGVSFVLAALMNRAAGV